METNSITPPAVPLYVVTGATDNTGSVITRRLAEQGKAVLLASLNLERAEASAAALREATGNKDISCLQLDLSSFEMVRDFVARLKALRRPIAALVNNASTLPRHSKLSPDGFEHTIQVNFLSTVLLSMATFPIIEDGGKIILSTSVSRRFVSLPYEFPAVSHFTQIGAYAQSKLALTLFSIYMSTVMKIKHVSVNCVNPGVLNTGMLALHRWLDRAADYLVNPLRHPESGVESTLRALESNDSGFIFTTDGKQVKTSTMLKNREVFIKLCNDTMRIIKKNLPSDDAPTANS
ncbi:MAG: SDR family NAD(P)-dependent oxidoreductase [Muribaculaceae bacterium]|nr:SDR family NAD(P)-dependent oxidoreductase [Muribaculaceae bacterium]MBQ2235661.1 SDR family NAD(P)-dependent oxidoreductase [Muribaculaceae bacterium]MBQ4006232.1 SDR family NAD(P)-dependent oxidoreductase [Muribaculaceae bacterium]